MNKSLTYFFVLLLLVSASGCGGGSKADLLVGDETISEDTSTDKPETGPEDKKPEDKEDEDGDKEKQEVADAIDSSEAIDGEIVADNSNTDNTASGDNNVNTDDNNDTSDDDADASNNPDSSDDTGGNDNDGSGDTETADEESEYALIQKTTVDISSYNYFEKKMTSGTYDAYSLTDSGLRVICQQPCAVPENLLKKRLLGAETAMAVLLELTVLDVVSDNKPVDIHVTSSAECGDYDVILTAYGYVARYFGVRFDGTSYMCLWEYDDDGLVLPLNDANAQKIEAQQVFVHEYSHILFDGRTTVPAGKFEDFAKALSFYVAGHWDGNALEPENFPKVTDACNPYLEKKAADVYKLCTKCGFSFDDISVLLQKMDEANAEGDLADKDGLKTILDGMTGKDAAAECGLEWLL